MAFTHGDQYKPMPGFQVLTSHFHFHFNEQLTDAGTIDREPSWLPVLRDLGINIAILADFHSDSHPNDTGKLRLGEQQVYFDGVQRFSDRDFLLIPGEEPDANFGGHYMFVFPKPLYFTHVKLPAKGPEGQPFEETLPRYGKVYHTTTAASELKLLQQEKGLVWQTHPRTKGSTGFPDKIRDTAYFRSDRWLGGAFKALPVDLSEKKLCERRCFDVLDDMNNWGQPKFLVAEVDTYKKFPEYDLYGDFNVNYVQLDSLPGGQDWSPILRALREGRFFVSTGEVLIRNFRIEGDSGVSAEVEWTFPLEFLEVVWGDGKRTSSKIVSATDQSPFGSHHFKIPIDLKGQKWVRLAVWDSAVNGAFTQPAHLTFQ